MPAETPVPIRQIIANYTNSLAAFPPGDQGVRPFYDFITALYPRFERAAEARGIPAKAQPRLLESVQKKLWAFGLCGVQSRLGAQTSLEIQPADFPLAFKQPRVEEAFDLLSDFGAQVALFSQGGWSTRARIKDRSAARLAFQTPEASAALACLVQQVTAGTPKEKLAFERFLRADPGAVLACQKPGLSLDADAPEILVNLPAPAAEAWRSMAGFLLARAKGQPEVEFRSIRDGEWVVNYTAPHGGRDLAGLNLENGQMKVRAILFGAMNAKVGEHLDEFGDHVRKNYHEAHWYEEFQHKWLGISPANRWMIRGGSRR